MYEHDALKEAIIEILIYREGIILRNHHRFALLTIIDQSRTPPPRYIVFFKLLQIRVSTLNRVAGLSIRENAKVHRDSHIKWHSN